MGVHVFALLLAVTGPVERACQEIAPDVVRTFRSARHGRPEGLHYGSDFWTQADRGLADARAVTLDVIQAIVEVDTGKLKGDPSMLAWSPDRSELYVQTSERDRRGAVISLKHYVVPIASKSLKKVDQQPAWATAYWTWKSGQASPAAPAFRIVADEREETRRATAAVGDLAKGGGGASDGLGISGTTAEEAANIANQSQLAHIWRLKVRGETLGEWVNEPVVPGVNYGWAPAPVRLIVFAKRDGGPLVVLDDQGRKQELEATKNASLPAWSNDGGQLAWLAKKDRKKYDLMIAAVTAK
jgi:hypothetical protein